MWFLSFIPVVGQFFDWLNKKQDVDLEKYKVKGNVDVKAMETDADIIRARAQLAAARSDDPTDRAGRRWFIYPTGIWYTLVVLDTTLTNNNALSGLVWRIPELPASVQYVPLAVIAYLFATTIKNGMIK